MSDTPFRPPLTVHEGAVERHFPRDPRTRELVHDPDLSAAATAMKAARGIAEQIAATAAALHADPTRTGAAAAVELRRLAPTMGERAGAALDGAAARLTRSINELTATMAPPAPRNAEELALATELRAALAKMKAPDRAKAIGDAITSGDAALAAAVLRAPALLSGMTPEVHAALRQRWQDVRHPETSARAARLGQALGAVEAGGKALVGYVTGIASIPGAAAAEAAANTARAAVRAVETGE